jgi:hypothetical protein
MDDPSDKNKHHYNYSQVMYDFFAKHMNMGQKAVRDKCWDERNNLKKSLMQRLNRFSNKENSYLSKARLTQE